ncbi:MAG: helix-turn-helix domain-containing protein [Nanoarchaeota archaeon]
MNLKQLKEINLSDGQIQVYTAVLEIGMSSLNKIQEKTGIERRNIYDILNKLIEKGLITYITEKGKKTYQCAHPNKILEEINSKEAKLEELKGKITEIEKVFAANKPSIGAEVYRGNESIKSLMNEMLEYKESCWIGGNSGIETNTDQNMAIWFSHWMKKRVELKHSMYDLADYGTYLKGLEPNKKSIHKKNLYEIRYLPKDLSSPMVIAVFGNKVAQILWSKQSFAFVIESDEIKDSFMRYFHYFWDNTKH